VDFEKESYSVVDLSEDAIAILDDLSIKKAHVVGHSMGGTIAQLLAIFHPDRLLSCTSCSVSGIGASVVPDQKVMKVLLENTPTQNFEDSLDGFIRSWNLLNGDFPLDEQMAGEYTKELYARSLHPVGVAWNHIRCQEKLPNLSKQLKEITVPTLFLHGGRDVLIPVDQALNAARAIPKASLEILPQMGHMMFHRELQRQIAELLLDHFGRCPKSLIL
jgi:pimeloyl-ACP methyl ester carboxylesterase